MAIYDSVVYEMTRMPHKHHKTWLHPLFECRNLHKYVCAMVFPCVPMNTVRRLIMKEHDNSDVESSAAAVISVAPLLVGAMSFNQEIEQGLQHFCHGDDGEYDDEMENSTLARCACLIYPLLICPTTCVLRSYAIDRVKIQGEPCYTTALLSTLCWPCVLVQTEDELQGEAHAGGHIRHLLRS